MVANKVPLVLDGFSLSIEKVCKYVQGHYSRVELSPDAEKRIHLGRQVVDRYVKENIQSYGISTGVGAQKDYDIASEMSVFNRKLLIAHSTVVPGPLLSKNTVKGTLLIQLNLYATGRCGISWKLVQALLQRINDETLPDAVDGCSTGASDIVTLSQMALPFFGKSVTGKPPLNHPLLELSAKEGLSLMNSNSAGLSITTLSLHEARRIMMAFDFAGAMSLEAIRGQLKSYLPIVDKVHYQPAQKISASNIRKVLEGSILWQDGQAKFLQDPLSFRCIAQVHAAAWAAQTWTEDIVQTEINASVDNPLVDFNEDGEDAGSSCISHGNIWKDQ
eukprot:TRINITY_DN7886_c0_g1_i2.p1 TRINITY_DN7886_c0_g1~~TRINITY_DN7886_c0_g1_i2.p1  ORF type:complete len:332 (-),score=69.39 TRINITY_DN7886_c0_g1_i2:526-1521(-)